MPHAVHILIESESGLYYFYTSTPLPQKFFILREIPYPLFYFSLTAHLRKDIGGITDGVREEEVL